MSLRPATPPAPSRALRAGALAWLVAVLALSSTALVLAALGGRVGRLLR